MATVAITQDVLRTLAYNALVADNGGGLAAFVATLASPYSGRTLAVRDGQRIDAANTVWHEPPAAYTFNGPSYPASRGSRSVDSWHVTVVGHLPVPDKQAGNVVVFPQESQSTEFARLLYACVQTALTAKGYPISSCQEDYRKDTKFLVATLTMRWRIAKFDRSTYTPTIVSP